MRTLTIAIAISLSAAYWVAACSPAVVSEYCQIARPITFSASQDSAETIRQAREHNAAYRRLCDG